MIQLTVPVPPADALARIAAFGKEWRESKIPAELRHVGVLGSTAEVRAPDFTMRLQAMQRSPNFILRGSVSATANGGAQITGQLELSSFNRALGAAGVVVVAWIVGQEHGLGFGLLSGCLLAGFLAGTTALGRSVAEPRFQKVLESALAGVAAPAI